MAIEAPGNSVSAGVDFKYFIRGRAPGPSQRVPIQTSPNLLFRSLQM